MSDQPMAITGLEAAEWLDRYAAKIRMIYETMPAVGRWIDEYILKHIPGGAPSGDEPFASVALPREEDIPLSVKQDFEELARREPALFGGGNLIALLRYLPQLLAIIREIKGAFGGSAE